MARPELYPYTEKELAEKIDRYFEELEANPTKRGGPADLLVALDMDEETAKSLYSGDVKVYKKYRDLMAQAAQRLRAHIETSPAWSGPNQTKSMFILKQQLWDGKAYKDKVESKGADATVRIIFGDGKGPGDAFG